MDLYRFVLPHICAGAAAFPLRLNLVATSPEPGSTASQLSAVAKAERIGRRTVYCWKSARVGRGWRSSNIAWIRIAPLGEAELGGGQVRIGVLCLHRQNGLIMSLCRLRSMTSFYMKPIRCFLLLTLAAFASLHPALADDKKEMARKAAVEKLTDQDQLAKIAVEDKSAIVRDAAVGRLTDPTMLARVALQGTSGITRKAAMDKVTDQSVLASVALKDKACDSVAKDRQWSCIHYYDKATTERLSISEAAARKLTEQALLARVSLEAEDETARRAAVMGLTDQPLLAKVALEETVDIVRRTALGKLTDQALLAKLVLETTNETAHALLRRVTDQAALARVALEDKDEPSRRYAVEKLTDQNLLLRIALEDKAKRVRMAAVGGLTDKSLLEKIPAEDRTASPEVYTYTYTSTFADSAAPAKGKGASAETTVLTIEFHTDGPLTPRSQRVFTFSYGPYKYSSTDPGVVARSTILAVDPVTQLPSEWSFDMRAKSDTIQHEFSLFNGNVAMRRTISVGGSSGLVLLTALEGSKGEWRMTP